MTPQINDTWYRYEYTLFGDAADEYFQTKPRVLLDLVAYRVTKVTDCGIWVNHKSKPKFILLKSGYGRNQRPTRKRFAHPDQTAALESFIFRKEHQIWHLQRQLDNARRALIVAKDLEKKNDERDTKVSELRA